MPSRPSNIDCGVDVTSNQAHRQRDKNNTCTKNKIQRKDARLKRTIARA